MDISPSHRTWLYLAALLGTAQPLVAFNVYALFMNNTAHTGLPTRWIAWGMLAVSVVAAVGLWAELRGPSQACKVLTGAILLLGLGGAANVWAFEHYNVMMGYEVWVKSKRMPAKYAPPGMGFQLPRNRPAPSEPPAPSPE